MWMVWFEQKLYKDSQKSGQENSGSGFDKTEDMNVCGGYRPPRVCGVYRVVWLYGEHVRVALCVIQFFF